MGTEVVLSRKKASMNTRELRALVRKLRKRFPVPGKITVRRYPAKRNSGVTTYDGRVFRIYIDSSGDKSSQVETLLHEWAHIRAIDEAYRHGRAWGRHYAEIHESWTHNLDETHTG